MSSLPSIDGEYLDGVAGGVRLSLCRDLTDMSKRSSRRGMDGLAEVFGDIARDCRATYRAEHPGIINNIKSRF